MGWRTWAMLPGFFIIAAAVAYQAACTDSAVSGGSSGTSGTSGGVVPGLGPPFVPGAEGGKTADPPTQSVTCDGGVVVGIGTVDQSQLTENGAVYLTPTTGEPIQGFTSGVEGYLTGVELFITRASVGNGATGGSVKIEILRNAGSTAIASATVPLSTFPISDERGTLSGGPGVGYLPLGPSCLRLSAGALYRMKLSLVDVADGVCSDAGAGSDAGICTIGRIGDRCQGSTQCDYRIRVEFKNNGDPYDAGALAGYSASDLVFRTYMQP